MAKADIKLPTGTTITIDGSAEEIAQIVMLYKGASVEATPSGVVAVARRGYTAKKAKAATKKTAHSSADSATSDGGADVAEIVNLIKDSEAAEAIEKNILDRISQVNKTLLPLFALHQSGKESQKLHSGDIAKVLKQLGVPMSLPNVSRTLSGTASKYVMADSVRKRGKPTGYALSRRGVQYMTAVIAGSPGEN